MHTLSNKYFEPLFKRSTEEFEYEAYRPLGYPMLLFSLVDGSPLAALHFRCQDRQQSSRARPGTCLFSRRPTRGDLGCDFQGLADTDGQDIELVISNLTRGHINFNILREAGKVTCVDPGPVLGLNQINELRPDESVPIQSDQATKRSLVLRTLGGADRGKTIAADESEAAATKSKAKGTYYFLSVVADAADAELVKLFKETKWSCVDYFVRWRPVVKPAPRSEPIEGGRRHVAPRERTRDSEDWRRAAEERQSARPSDHRGGGRKEDREAVRSRVDAGHHARRGDERRDDREHVELARYARRDERDYGDRDTRDAGGRRGKAEPAARAREARSALEEEAVRSPRASPAAAADMAAEEGGHEGDDEDEALPLDGDGESVEMEPESEAYKCESVVPRGVPVPRAADEFPHPASRMPPPTAVRAPSLSSSPSKAGAAAPTRSHTLASPDAGKDSKAKRKRSTGPAGPSKDGDSKKVAAASARPPAPKAGPAYAAHGDGLAEDVILKSKAARMEAGREVVVHSAQTGREYAYDFPSAPCTIGLSVLEGLRLLPAPAKDQIAKEADTAVNERIANKVDPLLAKLTSVFVEEDCCLCLEEAPDCVFYQCGHQCTHHSCASGLTQKLCPLCRTHVSALIRVAPTTTPAAE